MSINHTVQVQTENGVSENSVTCMWCGASHARLQGGWERIFKRTSTPYTGQLLALCISGWCVECIGRPWSVTLITRRLSPSLCWWRWQRSARPVVDDHFRIVQNTNLLEKELSQHGYDAILLQYCNILYSAMCCAINSLLLYFLLCFSVCFHYDSVNSRDVNTRVRWIPRPESSIPGPDRDPKGPKQTHLRRVG